MMKIHLKNNTKTTYIISVDNEIWGILPAKILPFFSLYPNLEKELPTSEKDKILIEIKKYSWNRLLNFLAYRERSIGECRSFLQKQFLLPQIMESLIEKALHKNFINDERFAEMYVQDLLGKNKNKTEIKTKLIGKHISKSLIDKVITKYFTNEMEEQVLSANYNKAINRFNNIPAAVRKEKILNYLTRKGFSYWQVKEKMEKDGY